jgi:hypothetical protein
LTIFEYLAISFSLVFSFTAMRLLAGLPYAVRRERVYWVHFSFVCVQLILTVVIFWAFWSYRDTEWTLPRFLLALGSPALIYFNACTLIPENPGAIESWREYFDSVRRRYFIGLTCWVLVVAIGSTLMLQMPWFHPGRLGQTAGAIVGIVGVLSDRPQVHACLAIFFIAFAFVATFTFALQPGSLAP